ncbi:MAG: WD40 repeat domain-containing protein [Thermoguttaceae bacterium]
MTRFVAPHPHQRPATNSPAKTDHHGHVCPQCGFVVKVWSDGVAVVCPCCDFDFAHQPSCARSQRRAGRRRRLNLPVPEIVTQPKSSTNNQHRRRLVLLQLASIVGGVAVMMLTFLGREPSKIVDATLPPSHKIASAVSPSAVFPAHPANATTTASELLTPITSTGAEWLAVAERTEVAASPRIAALPIAPPIAPPIALPTEENIANETLVTSDPQTTLNDLFTPSEVRSEDNSTLASQQLERAAAIASENPLESLAMCLEVNDLLVTSQRSETVAQQSHLLRALLLGLRVAEPVMDSLPQIESIAVTPRGRFIAAACRGGTIKLWDAQKHEVKTLTETASPVVSLCMTPDERFVVAGCADGTITWWWTRPHGHAEQSGFTLPVVLPGLRKVALSPDGLWMVAFTGTRNERNVSSVPAQCLLWNIASVAQCQRLVDAPAWHQPIPLRGHTQPVKSLAFCRHSHWLAIGSEDGSLRIYDLTATVTGIGLSAIKAHDSGILSIAIAPDHSWIATGGEDNTIRLWGLKNGMSVPLGTLTGHRGWVTVLTALPNSQTLLSGGLDQQLLAWNVGTLRAAIVHTPIVLATRIGGVRSIEISPDNSFLSVLSGTSSLQLWRVGSNGDLADPITLSPRGPSQFPIADIHFDANNRLIQAVSPRAVPQIGSAEWSVHRLPLDREEMITLAHEVVDQTAAATTPRR